jgi:integrase
VAANYDEKRLGRQRAVPKRLHPHLSQQHWRGADLDNLADRVIRPTLKAHNLMWKGWQAYRRGLATNIKELGVPDTTIQCILRHENVNTTQRFYIKTASAVAVDAMKKSEEKISGTAVVQ